MLIFILKSIFMLMLMLMLIFIPILILIPSLCLFNDIVQALEEISKKARGHIKLYL